MILASIVRVFERSWNDILGYAFRTLVEGASNLLETFENPVEDEIKIKTKKQKVYTNESSYVNTSVPSEQLILERRQGYWEGYVLVTIFRHFIMLLFQENIRKNTLNIMAALHEVKKTVGKLSGEKATVIHSKALSLKVERWSYFLRRISYVCLGYEFKVMCICDYYRLPSLNISSKIYASTLMNNAAELHIK